MGCCFGKLTEQLEQRVDRRFSESQIIAKEIFWANLQYQRSQRYCKIQGNGALVLTSDVLWFNLLSPNKQIEIPLRNIRAVYDNGKSGLFVDFVDVSGIEDQVMIALRKAQSWKNVIIGQLAGPSGSWRGILEERVNKNFAQGQIIAKVIFWANLRYQRSAARNVGEFQIQGNGALVLTSDVLWFSLLIPNKQIEMPLRNIRVVQVGREEPALFVDFVNPTSGIEDQVVIQLQELESWKRMIDENIKKQLQLQFLDPRFTL